MTTRRGYKLEPQTIDRNTWFYEEPRGLLVVHEARDADGGYLRTDQFVIPWRKVVASVRRHSPQELAER